MLREIAAWRETEAATSDLPVGWILKDPTLIEIAARRPANGTELAEVNGIGAKKLERYGEAVLALVKE